jgi:hypothetical protein
LNYQGERHNRCFRSTLWSGGVEFESNWGKAMQAKAINHVSDVDLDMSRRRAHMHAGMMRRWLDMLLSFQGAALVIGTPRRSIDREAQEYSPYYD